MHLRCKNAATGCAFIAQVVNIDKHEGNCQFAPKPVESSPLKSKKETDKVPEGGARKRKCENGCGKDLDSNELEVHDCVQWLLGLIKNEREEKKKIDEQIGLAETDLSKVNNSYASYKDQSDKIIEELKEKLINGESDNETLRKEHLDALKNICTTSNFKLKIFKENSEKRVQQYLERVHKDLGDFQQKLSNEFDQYNEKAKKEFVNYEIKAKADFNGIAPQKSSRSKSPNSTSSKKSFSTYPERPGSSLLSPKKSTSQSKKASVMSSPYSQEDGKRV